MDGSILLSRGILDSQVFSHQTALKIWIWCLCKATYKERFVPLKIGKGEISVKLLPGQFIFGRFKAEDELGIDGSTIYRWINRFVSDEYGMLKIECNNQYSIITICKWDEYQVHEKKSRTTNEQPMNSGRTAEEQPTNTNNKDNKVNKEEELKARSLIFKNQVLEFKDKYPAMPTLKEFFEYWSEPNKSKTKMRYELQQTWDLSLRLKTWVKRDKNFAGKTEPISTKQVSTGTLISDKTV